MKYSLTVLALGLMGVISGCSPVPSIRPLYTDADLQKPVAEPRIEGEWISPDVDKADVDKAGTDEELWLKWKIEAPPPPVWAQGSYVVEFRPAKPDPGEENHLNVYYVRLVAISDKLFFDAEFRRYEQGKEEVGSTDILGLVPAHLVGRVWVQQDFLRIALLAPDWVKQNWPTGFYKNSDDSIVITGSTQELRDFLVQNADNPKALGYVVYLCRPGTDCAARAAEDALARTPDDDDVLEAAANFYIARGNYARAATLRQHLAELDPDTFSRHVDASDAYLLARDFAAARQESEATEKLLLEGPAKPPSSLPNNLQAAYAHAAENTVWSYFLEGKYAEAIEAAKNYKPDAAHSSVNPLLLRYFSLIRLGRRGEAESLLKEETAKFQGPAVEHVLLLEAQGRVTEGLSLDAKSETSRRSSFFSGLREIAAGKPARHLEYATSEPSESVVALAARIELERLGPKPKK